jgi:hypothetical protein
MIRSAYRASRSTRWVVADMALAPRARQQSRSSVATAAGKRAQRARNKIPGVKPTSSGSSGAALAIKDAPKRLWDEVKDEVVHVCDIAGKLSHSQIGNSGYMTATLNAPLDYAHDLLDAHISGRDGLVYIRIYHVPLERYLAAGNGKQADDADEHVDYSLDAFLGSD